MDESQLALCRILALDDVYVLGFQFFRQFADGGGKLLGILGIELAELLQQLLCTLALALRRLACALGYAALGGHTHSEKLVEIV